MNISSSDMKPDLHSTVVLDIEGMTCASCVGRVERALKAVPRVETASVNLATERAEITGLNLDRSALVRAVETVGYDVRSPAIDLAIEGMTCASCVSRVERALKSVPGVTEATVNLATERAHVTGQADAAALIRAIDSAGYDARIAVSASAASDEVADRKAAEEAALKRDLWIAAALTLPVFLLEMGSHLFTWVHMAVMNTIGMQNSWYVQFALTTAVLLGPGRRFYTKGFPALARLAPDMNSLVAVGTSAAYGYSLVATFVPALLPAGTVNVYFEAAAVIVTLILMGRWLEARAKGQAGAAIRQLMDLAPETATLLRDGRQIVLPIDQVQVGDLLLLSPGQRVPLDGVITEGAGRIDESMLTGEPAPVAKTTGDTVTGGTVNGSAAMTLRVTATGGDTVLSRIVTLVEGAQNARLPVQALVDKVTRVFVPCIIALSVLTLILWLIFGPGLAQAVVAAVAVLIIACPCAMGLAAPTSILVGTGRGAQSWAMLFRQGDALQALQDVRVVAFDKTGTLTEGRPQLTDLNLAPGFDRASVLAAVAAVEAKSEHPIARAIVAAAAEEGLTLPHVSGFTSQTGYGVQAQAGTQTVDIGADRFMTKLGLDVALFADVAAQLAEEGKSPLYAAINGRLAAILAVADPIKKTTPQAIRALHALGLKVAMITGDNARTAQAIARQLGIDEVVAEVLPDGKVAAVKRLQALGPVAYVGDGINDAPALAEADVGLAVGTGTDIAIEAADVVLMTGRLTAVSDAIALSKATMRNIRQNLFWAFAYNAALIPVAAGVLWPSFGILLSPVFAAGAMALSSVFVLGNALRLKRYAPAVSEKI